MLHVPDKQKYDGHHAESTELEYDKHHAKRTD